MSPKILLGCYEIPGYGGASTAGYALFEMLRLEGLAVSWVNLINETDADYFRYVFGEGFGNPKGLTDVHNCVLNHPLFSLPHAELIDLIGSLDPDIIIGIDFIPALLMKQSAPRRPLVFLTAGSSQAQSQIINHKARDAIEVTFKIQNTPRTVEPIYIPEKQAVVGADLILAHSEMMRIFYDHFYPAQVGKIYPDVIWFAEWIHQSALEHADLRKPFSKRDIDLLFVASIWSRTEKNWRMVRDIVSRSRDLNIHIVGENEDKTISATQHGLITNRRELFALLGRTKTLVCPSLLDSAPGILFEASTMGCNIVASKNCGNWKICNEHLLVDPFNRAGFENKIRLSLTQEYPSNLSYFLTTGSFHNLIKIVSALV